MKKQNIINSVITGSALAAVICLIFVFLGILKPGGFLEKFLYGGMVLLFRTGIVLPMFLVIASAVLVWSLKKEWKYMAAFGTSLAAAVVLLTVELLILPGILYGYLQDMNALDFLVGEISYLDVSRAVAAVLGPVYWVAAMFLIVAACFCLAGHFSKETQTLQSVSEIQESQNKEEANREEEEVLGLLGLQGSYAGGRIPVKPGEMLMLGSDSSLCNLVLVGEEIRPQHCCIVYEPEQKQYLIRNLAQGGVFREDGSSLKPGEDEYFSRGSILVLGEGTHVFQLQ